MSKPKSESAPPLGPEDAVRQGVAVFQAHPGADDDTIAAELEAGGLSEAMATRVIQMLPIAFCRVLLTPQGVRFPEYYSVMGPKGVHVGNFLLAEEPIFAAALRVAQQEMEAGRGGAPYLAIAGRSGGFKAVMKLANEGSQLSGILCAPPILMSDRRSWEPDLFAGEPARQPWWKRWRG